MIFKKKSSKNKTSLGKFMIKKLTAAQSKRSLKIWRKSLKGKKIKFLNL